MNKTYSELQMPEDIRNSINESVGIIQNKLKNTAQKIFLFGSYARGDYAQNSDIDLFILVTAPREDANKIVDEFFDDIYDLDLRNNIIINPLVENINFYEQNQDKLLLFENIDNEGVLLYEQ